ncbi:hypothetical protein Bca52824_001077 [Brassica carinata]|uniref:Uncharacterized protein n=1 Tax=Brassica carinata TaxID=52824 RepID=A0A8X7WID2_BRACI|nr:hypothetical protein Bca52824_001077 [Brassica carinata]
MSSSSSSPRSHTHRTTVGIPSRCWCGSKLTTFGAQTKENLYCRFYRYEVGVKRQSEHHLFKWIDETIIDEIRVVDSKHCQLQEDVQSFKSTTKQCLQEHGKYIDESLLELKRIIHDQKMLLFELRRDPTLPDASLESSVTKSPSPLINISASDIALGTMAWLYAKLST